MYIKSRNTSHIKIYIVNKKNIKRTALHQICDRTYASIGKNILQYILVK